MKTERNIEPELPVQPLVPDWVSSLFAQMPKPIAPIVETQTSNAPLVLHEGRVRLFANDKIAASGTGSISLHWQPTPSLWYTVKPASNQLEVFEPLVSGPFKLGVRFDDFPGTTENTDVSGLETIGLLRSDFSHRFKQGFTHSLGQPLTKIVFHVANCVPFFGTAVGSATQSEKGFQASTVNGRCQFNTDGWNVTLDRTPQADDLVKELDDEPGYGLTHVGEICRSDGSSFLGPDAKNLLENLAYLLSFCSGRWCGPLLAYGFNENEDCIWVDWHVGRLDPWKTQWNWFPLLDEKTLPYLAPRFLDKMAEAVWNQPLRVAISWYLDALNPSTVDTGVVLGQVGLELLAWTQLVHSRKLYTKNEFEKLTASEKIAELLTRANVSTAIPSVYNNLEKYAVSINKGTGPDVFVRLRNALVHGSDVQKYLGAGGDARVEAWLLGIGYLELAIMNLTGYAGQYYNRATPVRDAAVYEDVPWKSSTGSN